MLMYRKSKNCYVISSSDHEVPPRKVTKAEAKRMLKARNCPPKLLREIMSQTKPGYVMT